ncbi:hypothetical protein AB0A77_20775 [Streptomyces varsoviensis]|uniref:hypothetical protein n=1 Tax=Streptomyces varsoviensis TaxID=67373 RepID=UPI0033E4EE57
MHALGNLRHRRAAVLAATAVSVLALGGLAAAEVPAADSPQRRTALVADAPVGGQGEVHPPDEWNTQA